ncbi:MAG TPA: TIGR02611 family protein [Actinomycetes bacterium]|nr:TIGR02611 family protein [Actinomycetes bacterium]
MSLPSSERSTQPDDFDPPGPDWLYRLRQRFAGTSKYRQLLWRVVATFVGGAILLAGLAMLALPGPGWAAIFLGLAVLATEYAWAHRLLRFSKDKAQGAASAAFSRQNRGRAIALAIIVLLLVAALVSWYVYYNGWSFDRLLGWFGLG